MTVEQEPFPVQMRIGIHCSGSCQESVISPDFGEYPQAPERSAAASRRAALRFMIGLRDFAPGVLRLDLDHGLLESGPEERDGCRQERLEKVVRGRKDLAVVLALEPVNGEVSDHFAGSGGGDLLPLRQPEGNRLLQLLPEVAGVHRPPPITPVMTWMRSVASPSALSRPTPLML